MTTPQFPEEPFPTTPPPDPRTDAQWAAQQAVEALTAGRFALGSAFARIARLAYEAQQHAERNRLVPPVVPGPPREWPFSPTADDTVSVAFDGPAPDPNRNVAPDPRTDDTASLVFGEPARNPADAGIVVGTTTRCVQNLMMPTGPDGSTTIQTCHRAIYLGDDGVWKHLHMQLSHAAVPPPRWNDESAPETS